MRSINTAQLWQASLPEWGNHHDNHLVCCHVRQETHDVKSFFFTSKSLSLFKFLPGQFITLEVPINGEIIHRSYTISSAPSRPHVISITVKRKPDGVVSNWLHQHLTVGTSISALGSAGDFTCVTHPAKKYLFLSGGVGITPLMSMARSFYELAEDPDMVFLHSARTPADIIFKKELDLMAFNQAHFRPVYLCAKIDSSADTHLQAQCPQEGVLNTEYLQHIAPDFLEREVFTCGPVPYMEAVQKILKNAGFNMAHYHEERFSFDEVPTHIEATAQTAEKTHQSTALQDNDTQTFSIEFIKSGMTIECDAESFVLDATRAAGLRFPSSCSKGLCGTCKSKLISGQVKMEHGGGIRQREIDQGLFLPCCAKPLSHLVIER